MIIDAPPLLPVTDAAVLTRSADGALVVISHGGTLDYRAGRLAVTTSRRSTAAPSGIVFNRMRRSGAAAGCYGGDYYRYEYKPESQPPATGNAAPRGRRPQEC